MTRRVIHSAVLIILLSALALPALAQQYYMYEPKPVTSEEKKQTKDGVLVTEVPVHKGDTLYDISRKYSGRGMYYPQILLFNKINNPRLIYPGDILKVPVTQSKEHTESLPARKISEKSRNHKERYSKTVKSKAPVQQPVASTPGAAQPTDIPLSDLKGQDRGKREKNIRIKKGSRQYSSAKDKSKKTAVADNAEARPNPAGEDTSSGRKLFERAVTAYKQDNFSAALALFDRYLADSPNSPLAADASLYKAECYLKLSSQ